MTRATTASAAPKPHSGPVEPAAGPGHAVGAGQSPGRSTGRPRPFRLTAQDAPESAILDAVLRYLALDRRVAWAHRFNTGAHVVYGANKQGKQTRRYVRYGFAGCSDVLGQLTTGHVLAVETKTRTGLARPEQAAFLSSVRRAGGCSVLARSVDDVRAAIDAFYLD